MILAALALVAIGLPVHAESVHARNVSHLWSLLGDADPETLASMPDGRIVPLTQAINEAAARAGSVDLAGIASGAAPAPDGLYIGDIWVLDIGPGGCTATVLLSSPVPFMALDPQLWLYAGAIGTMSGDGAYSLSVYGWTMKMTYTGVGHWEATGQSDFYCFSFGGLHIAFPFIDGIVQVS